MALIVSYIDCGLSVAASTLWNKLLVDIKNVSSLENLYLLKKNTVGYNRGSLICTILEDYIQLFMS